MIKIIAPIIFLVCPGLFASSDDFSAKLFADKPYYSPGDTAILALECRIPKDFHLYGNPLGPGIGKPLQIIIKEDSGLTVLSILKPKPKKFDPGLGGWVYAYENTAIFFIKIATSPTDIRKGAAGAITVDGLICHTSCLPVTRELPFTLYFGNKSNPIPASFNWRKRFEKLLPDALSMSFGAMDKASPSKTDKALFLPQSLIIPNSLKGPSADSTVSVINENQMAALLQREYHPVEPSTKLNLILALFFGFLAGVLLNVMPCVLPVLGIKVLSFSESRSLSRTKTIIKSLVFSAGMLSVFMVLASLAAFAQFSWGQQFQKPVFLAAIICIVFMFALGMFDLYSIPLPAALGRIGLRKIHGMLRDFVSGMVTTLLATPCSGPFLGGTLTWTLTQQPPIIFAIFLAIGTGMAFPYVLFASSRTLLRLVPKPGKWMVVFKHAMGILLLVVVGYLMIGLPWKIVLLTVGICALSALILFLFHRFAINEGAARKKIIFLLLSMVILVGGLIIGYYKSGRSFFLIQPSSPIVEQTLDWQEFSMHALSWGHSRNRIVIVDFTAAWCLNCQYNTISVLKSNEIKKLIFEKNILALKADLTNSNLEAEDLLHSLGSRSIPFLAIFPGNDPEHPIIMRDILKKHELIKTINNIH
ncbi:MAG: cytochrome c biogenesis protein CcdA [Chitinivibrionales bacterium]|nr:cytochrome c biogenesis protein CcdA [Chitinivibrionales bacterium]